MSKKNNLSIGLVFILAFQISVPALSLNHDMTGRSVGFMLGLGGATMAVYASWFAYNTREQVAHLLGFTGGTTVSEGELVAAIAGALQAASLGAMAVCMLSGPKADYVSTGTGVVSLAFGLAALVANAVSVGILDANSSVDMSNAVKSTVLSGSALVITTINMAITGLLMRSSPVTEIGWGS